MTQPAVRQTELDGALKILPSADDKAICVISPASQGPLNAPAAYGANGIAALKTAFGARGIGVQFSAYHLATAGTPVLFVRSGDSVNGSYLNSVAGSAGTISAIDSTNKTGSSAITNNASDPLLAGSWQVLFLVGGTRGSAGIVYQVFKDGVSYVPPVSLGTAVTITIGTTQISIALAAGTIVAGDYVTFTTTAPIPSSAGTLTNTGAGSSAVSIAAVNPGVIEPDDDYQCTFEVVNGGTIGTPGITFKHSLDDGRTPSELTALGSANFFVFPNCGGIRINFGAGTLLAGQKIRFDAVAPCWNTSELTEAINAAKASAIPWEEVHIIGPIDGAAFDLIETLLQDKKHYWYGNTRMPIGSETESTYQASLATMKAARATIYGSWCAGSCELSSPLDGRKYRRPASWPLASRNAKVGPAVNIADVNLGPLPGCSIRDDAGNLKHHDETITPGLDDLGFHVLRTWAPEDNAPGVYSNRPRISSAAGSDFRLVPHRRIINVAHVALRAYLIRRLNQDIEISKKTGFITKAERLEIQSGAQAAIESALRAARVKASVTVTVSDNDDLLANAPITGRYRIVPPAYPELADFEGGFENPAANVVPV